MLNSFFYLYFLLFDLGILCHYDARVWAPPLKGAGGMFIYRTNIILIIRICHMSKTKPYEEVKLVSAFGYNIADNRTWT